MYRSCLRLVSASSLLLALVALSSGAQLEEERAKEKPKTVAEGWGTVRNFMKVAYDDPVAMFPLVGLKISQILELNAPDGQFLEVFLPLRSKDKDEAERNRTLLRKLMEEDWIPWARTDEGKIRGRETLRKLDLRIRQAEKNSLSQPDVIRDTIRQLYRTPEEKAYAIRELYQTGQAAVPFLIEALDKAKDPAERLALLDALQALNAGDTAAPILAALDSPNARLKLDLLDVLRKRHGRFAEQIVPHLWYPSANPDEDRAVRQKAKKLIADLQGVDESRLPAAKGMLAREAERFYQGKVTLGDPKAVGVWRWDGKGVVRGWPGAETITADQANEYWGLRFARQALNIDPAYRPAQVVFLGLAVRSRPGPETAELLARSSPELILELLDRALKEQRRAEILGTIAALRDRAEVRARRPGANAEPSLVKALYYPDPRVQMAAVEALLVIPGSPTPKTSLRIIEILSGQLTPLAVSTPGRRVLVARADPAWRARARDAVIAAGAEPILVSTGRDLMRQLRAHADVDAVLLDSRLPDPGLAYLLANLRQDVDYGRVPVLLAAVPETRSAHDLAACSARIQTRLDLIRTETRAYRTGLASLEMDEKAALQKVRFDKEAPPGDRYFAERSVRERFDAERRYLDRTYLDAARQTKDAEKLESRQRRLADRYDLEAKVREAQLERFTSRYPNVRVVHAAVFSKGEALGPTLGATIRDADLALTQQQRTDNAEVAIQILANLAQGRPAGYDVRPATQTVLAVLRAGKLSPRGQIAAADVAARLPGERAQAELLNALADGARPLEVRIAAGEGLVQSLQRFGLQLTRLQVASISELSKQKIDAKLKGQVDLVLGALRLCERKTGELLRQYNPQPVAPLAAPPEKGKEEKKGGEEKKVDEGKKG
jgi:CheY-like chemotaxis protein